MWPDRSRTGQRRRRLLATALATALSVLPLPVAAETVRGYVIDPTTNAAVPHAEVAFLLSGEEGLTEILRKTADTEGRFAFSGPFLTPGLRFILVAFHRGIPYPTSRLELGEQTEVILEVFEPTSDISHIHVGIHHLFLSLRPEVIEVAQHLHVENGSSRTYIGVGKGAERRVTEFRLPEGLFGLQGHSGQMAPLEGENRFAHSQPLVPGTTRIAFSFFLDSERFDGVYGHVAPFPTQALEVYVHPPDIDLGPPFEDLGLPTVPHDQPYRRFRIEGLVAGQHLDISLPLQRSRRWALKWAALGLALLGSGAAFAGSRAGRSAPPAEPSAALDIAELAPVAGVDPRADRAELEQLRRQLLAELAAYGRKATRGCADGYDERMDRAVAVYRLLDQIGSCGKAGSRR